MKKGTNRLADLIKSIGKKTTDKETYNTHLNKKDALNNCGGSEELYRVFLEAYEEEAEGKINILKHAYEEQNWKIYELTIHALKGTSQCIGANQLSELAAQLEKASSAKTQDIDYILTHHEACMELYRLVHEEVRDTLKNYN